MRTISSRKVKDPEFLYAAPAFLATIAFVFDREHFKTPTDKQLAKFDAARKIVEAHGGHMNRARHELAGPNKRFSHADVRRFYRLVRAAHPDLDVYTHWNGAGCYSASIGARMKPTTTKGRK